MKLDKPFSPQAWFDGLKAGHVFVTSGPMLELRINGRGMGSELQVAKGASLTIEASAALNPDIDELSALELIEQGGLVKAVSSQRAVPQISLRHEQTAHHGTWFIVRARGKDPNVVAHSAPIYVIVDGQSFWKPAAAPEIVSKLKGAMKKLLEPRNPEGTEAWETQEADIAYWDAQQAPLKARIDQANAIYDDLVKRASAAERH